MLPKLELHGLSVQLLTQQPYYCFDNCIKNVKTAPTAYIQSRGPVQGVQLAEMELQSSIYAHLSIKEATP